MNPFLNRRADRNVRSAPRRGFAVILVLGMIAMTLAVSYSLIRSQAVTARGSSNHELRSEARQAALTGLAAGMRRMNQADAWGGADSTFTGTINAKQTFSVQYATGDATLSPESADAAKWPYRTTITSTGFAVDPNSAATTTTYKVEAVVEFVPRKLADNPSTWSTMQNYRLYQTTTDDNPCQLPFRIDGPVRFQGSLSNFCSIYPTPSNARTRYLEDLQAMRWAGYADFRPFTGPITLPNSATTGVIRNLLDDELGLSLINASGSNVSNWSHPGNVTTYRLFPGGKSYSSTVLSGTVTGTHQPDPRTNPAGLFIAAGDVTLGNGANVTGTIIATGRVRFNGTGVSVQSHTLPALDGASNVVELPVVVAGGDLIVGDSSRAVVRGTTVAFGKFTASSGDQNTQFDLQGRLICRAFEVQSRSQFSIGSTWWSFIWSWFNNQLDDHDRIRHFPVYCAAWGMNFVPKLTIGPTSGGATVPQFLNASEPVYKVDTNDAGLRWSLIRMKEQP